MPDNVLFDAENGEPKIIGPKLRGRDWDVP